jgi:leucyl-tRNA synthetase
MFPYPSGAGLHVGHPLGYIASDIFSRYKRLKGFEVLHPMGYDSFGLPAEQYAIQTGQHPEITTKENIARYRKQLDNIGFSFDWDREVRTSNSDYYRWTQQIFITIFNSWYDADADKARSIDELVEIFGSEGNGNVNAVADEVDVFDATQWNGLTADEQYSVLLNYRMAYLSESVVNWCPALGTVLANDEVKNGVSERGGHPVEQKKMKQWSLRITAYAERLLNGLNELDWTDSLKEIQRNWIGRSEGARVNFTVQNTEHQIVVFTTRPDTIYGVSFMVLAPEHELVAQITTDAQKEEVEAYMERTAKRSERDRMSDVKTISGAFTGAYVNHPFTNEPVPVWIGDYVLATYGTGAVMAVPSGDQRDWNFANHFGLPIPNIIEGADLSQGAVEDKNAVLSNSDFLNGKTAKEAIGMAIDALEEKGIGTKRVNYKLRDAGFSRQRYWGEPIPVYFKNNMPYVLDADKLPLELPAVDKYLPTADGEPPLARAENWTTEEGYALETNTMPGWAGSSWYFLRYMDPQNTEALFSKEAVDYWNQIDLYLGGAEHATGHLLYFRFWTKFLYDRELISFEEPAKKLINQGMIQGVSKFVYRLDGTNTFVSKDLVGDQTVSKLHVDVSLVNGDELDTEGFKNWRPEYANAEFVLSEGKYLCGSEVEKMSKSKYNVVNPDVLIEQYGADALRLHEMFLGPIEMHKPWNTKGIDGVSRFLRKFWALYHTDDVFDVVENQPTAEELKTLHKAIKIITDDMERYSFNTIVSHLMIVVNELGALKCKNKQVLTDLVVLAASHAPHICEELWQKLGNESSVSYASFPVFNPAHLVESNHTYPVSFNGKMRFRVELALDLSADEVKEIIVNHEQSAKWLEGKEIRKFIFVPKKIINIVV